MHPGPAVTIGPPDQSSTTLPVRPCRAGSASCARVLATVIPALALDRAGVSATSGSSLLRYLTLGGIVKLAVFMDGTWNDPTDDTNINQLCSRVKERPRARGGGGQKKCYIKGVGNNPWDRWRGG